MRITEKTMSGIYFENQLNSYIFNQLYWEVWTLIKKYTSTHVDKVFEQNFL